MRKRQTEDGQVAAAREGKWASKARRERHANLEKAQRIAHLGFWELDIINDCMHCSDEAYRICGYEPDAGKPTTEKFISIVHPVDVSRAIGDLKMALLGHLPLVSEYRIVCAGGQARCVRFEFSEVNVDAAGQPIRLFGIIQDITEHKRAEEALKLTNYSLDNVRDCVVWFCPDGRINYANNAACRQFGYSRDEMLALTIFDINPTYTRESWAERWSELKGKGSIQLEVENRARDGHWFPLEVTNTYIKYGDREFMFGYARDITSRRQAEESLRESEAKFKALAETSSAAILVYQDDRYVYVNPSAEQITGYGADELLKMRFWDIFHPDEQNLIRERGRARLRGEAAPRRYEARYRTKDGRDGFLEINASTLYYGGRLAGLVTALDVTDRKRSEDTVSKAKQEAELYLDLMGHDINNMHQVALGYLELAEEMEGNERLKEFLERPRDVLLRSARLIDNVRKLQKLREGTYESGPVELVRTLADALQEFRDVPGKTLKLDTHGIADGYVQANELLYDVFANLVSNAIKHSGTHAEVNVTLERVRENGNDDYRIAVEDNGPGVADSFKDKVFNRLLRGDTTAKGMGLGLYIVKTLVDSYRGRVWVEDRVPGDHTQGAKFVVLLPALQDTSSE